jgi:hypothetical protein
MNEQIMLGRVLRSSSTTFTFGYNQPDEAPPVFGSLVRAELGDQHVYGLVYDVVVHDDPFVRQIVAAAGALTETRIQDMRQRRQVPVEVTALAVAYRQDDIVYQRIPPRPPGALQPIISCSHEEIRLVLADFDFFHTVLNNALCPTDELLAASLREAARCQLPGQSPDYLLRAGRELARQLAADLPRLDSILRRMAPRN